MTRIARIVVPGSPHHVTLRGNRGERVFFEDGDYQLYRDWLAQSCRKFGVSCWAYCLMPNHVHLILEPADASGLALALSCAAALRGLRQRAPRFADLIEGEADDAAFTPLRRAELIGRPLGAPAFLETIARQLGEAVAPAERGSKPRGAGVAESR
jgi:REP element-mobilizing transposase RayT